MFHCLYRSSLNFVIGERTFKNPHENHHQQDVSSPNFFFSVHQMTIQLYYKKKNNTRVYRQLIYPRENADWFFQAVLFSENTGDVWRQLWTKGPRWRYPNYDIKMTEPGGSNIWGFAISNLSSFPHAMQNIAQTGSFLPQSSFRLFLDHLIFLHPPQSHITAQVWIVLLHVPVLLLLCTNIPSFSDLSPPHSPWYSTSPPLIP